MTFIALEGCDGSGKSTLVDAIIKELYERFPGEEVAVHHFSQLKRDPIDEYALKFESYRPGQGTHIICDRLHWGETIYAPLYRGKSALDTPGFRWIELYLRARGATVWHVTAPLGVIESRLRQRGEDYLESHHVGHVWYSFSQVAKQSSITGGTADTSNMTPEEWAVKIVNEAVYQEEQAAYCFRPEYIGTGTPQALLVGDKQGTGDPGVTLAPFMARGTSSGKFLLDALPDTYWGQVGLVNANETKLEEVVESLFGPNVVALGANASDALDEIGVEHGVVPHPQYVRRFHNQMSEQYGQLIRDVGTTGADRRSWPR